MLTGVYFVKKAVVAVSKSAPNETIISGDLSCKVIDQLASLVDEILVPILSNSSNHDLWPTVIAKDIQKHVHSLKNTVYQVKGQVNGQTVLPMPVGVEKIQEAEKVLKESHGEICDLYLKSAIEGVVIKWASLINDVLVNDSAEKVGNVVNPVPSYELEFWTLRLKNLWYIYDQLKESKVRSMASILEITNSAYFSCFKNQFKNVVIALAEAKEINLYYKPLEVHLTTFEETDFSECIPLLEPLMVVLGLIWANCKYCDQSRIIILLKQICNLLILEGKKFLDPTTLFHSDIDEAMQRVRLCIETLKHFLKSFHRCKRNLHQFFRDREPQPWNFHPDMVFGRFNAFLERLSTIEWFFNTVLEFNKLEKIEIGGVKGRSLSSRLAEVYVEFQHSFSIFSGKSYDVLDPDDPAFLDDFETFKQNIFEMDMKLSAILCQAIEDCNNLDSIFKV
ncbi:hypothetical protein HHI36_015614 [Cryptolaemus montrouzieri]|uniref:Dynein heavy chain tail domain-containing protein n=1 Tax=Cryptolaemus montrouzieri TaxID=559131 RepID=A0ABD2N654_9CUCU